MRARLEGLEAGMTPFTLPAGYAGIQVVKSFQELVATPFAGGVNALCWQRTLPGNFREVVDQLGGSPGMTTLEDAQLDRKSVV